MELEAASDPVVEALRQVRSAYLGVIAVHERVAALLAAMGDEVNARAERAAAEVERDRLARLDARLAAWDDEGQTTAS